MTWGNLTARQKMDKVAKEIEECEKRLAALRAEYAKYKTQHENRMELQFMGPA